MLTGDDARARATADEALTIARATGDDVLIGIALGRVAEDTPDVETALALSREAAQYLRSAGAPLRVAQMFSYLGFAALDQDAYDHAVKLGLEGLEVAGAIDDPYTTAFAHGNLGLAALLSGDLAIARSSFPIELDIARRHGFDFFFTEGLLGLAALAAVDGADHRAGVLDAASRAAANRPNAPIEDRVEERVRRRFMAEARSRLGEADWAAAQAEGRAMSSDAAVAFALLPH